jgi:hypothetical protein
MYERDEPYYRLLAPFCDEFVGRQVLLDTVTAGLSVPCATLVFAGPGGVGKSALAIECVRRLYSAKEYGFIVSSASADWLDVLRSLATVLQVEWSTEIDRVETAVVGAMKERTGLLLIDNLENERDAQWLEDLCRDLPHHVKRIITSRVYRGHGDYINIRALEPEDAQALMISELASCGYDYESHDRDALQALIALTYHMPLALKWSAAIAAHERSLRKVTAVLRRSKSHDMVAALFDILFETLTPAAREGALISSVLGPSWTVAGVARGLQRPKEDVRAAFEELRLRRIIPAAPADDDHAARLLPITADLLSARLHQYRSFEETVRRRLGSHN